MGDKKDKKAKKTVTESFRLDNGIVIVIYEEKTEDLDAGTPEIVTRRSEYVTDKGKQEYIDEQEAIILALEDKVKEVKKL